MQKLAKTCVIVSGMHRSGTSALTRLLGFAGCALPKRLLTSTKGNETGHWESQLITDFNDKFLLKNDSSWADWRRLEYQNFSKKQINGYCERLKMLMENEYGDATLVVLKDPRICRFQDLAAKALKGAGYSVKFAIIVRNPVEVSKSLKARDGMLESNGYMLWLRYVLESEMQSRGFPRSFLTYEELLEDWPGVLRNVSNNLKITWPNQLKNFNEAAETFLNAAQWNQKYNVKDIPHAISISEWISKTYQIMSNSVDGQLSINNLKQLDEIRLQFDSVIPIVSGLEKDLRRNYSMIDVKNQELEEGIIWERSQKEDTVKAKQHEYDILKQDYSVLADKSRELKDGNSELSVKLAEKQQEHGFLKKKYSILTDQSKELEDKLKKQNRNLKSQVTRQKNKYQNLVANSEAQVEKFTSIVQTLKAENENLRTQFEGELTISNYRNDIIADMQNSTSWKMTRFPRKIIQAWRSKTIILAGLLGGVETRDILSASDNLQRASMYSKSAAISAARNDLSLSRSDVLDSNWFKANSGVLEHISDDNLPSITISAVIYNSERWLWNFFLSAEGLNYPPEKITFHFIDHGSQDKSILAIENFIQKNKSKFKSIVLFKRPNLGYGAGNDYGIRKSNDEFILVTNVDAELYPDSLRQVVETAIVDEPDVASWELRQTPYEHPKYYDPVTLLTNWSSHACILMRRSAYLSVGGYDKNIFMYGEDVELSYRFRAHGWKLKYIPKAVILHHVDLTDSTLRPDQLSGSTAANILLRYRYANIKDIAAGEAFFRAVRRNETDPKRNEAWKKTEKIVRKNRWHFIRKRKWNNKAKFPFQEFDYDVTRPGADVVTRPYSNEELSTLPLVSVVTRTHGPADSHLRNVMASVLNQTYPNIEHIIVEDKSDEGRSIVESYSSLYGARIKYWKSTGSGRSECGNFGVSKAKGKYICWLDNDDLLFADHIETLMRGFESNPEAVCSYALAWEAISDVENGKPNIRTLNLPELHNRPYDKERLKKENFIPIQAIIFRKELFDDFGGFNAKLSQLEDWNLWARYSECGDFIFSRRVTSLYLTPNDTKIREKRHMDLHAAYEDVRRLNIKEAKKIKRSLRSS